MQVRIYNYIVESIQYARLKVMYQRKPTHEQFKFFLMINPIKVLIHHLCKYIYRIVCTTKISLYWHSSHRVTFIICYVYNTVSGKSKFMNGSKPFIYIGKCIYFTRLIHFPFCHIIGNGQTGHTEKTI